MFLLELYLLTTELIFTNYFVRIAAYLDEASQLKSLPRTPRAISIASLCGYDNVPLCGDIYIGKYVGMWIVVVVLIGKLYSLIISLL